MNLSPAVDFYGTRFTLSYDPASMRPLIISRGDALVDEGRYLMAGNTTKARAARSSSPRCAGMRPG